ncbi:two-component sensor histidine kinase [Sphingomonas zeicaulis]|uniref:sensor histidine kinase n=1 Tax=Sphingomonas zeicaulis TaxID=1632740 RepID=UPI003D202659
MAERPLMALAATAALLAIAYLIRRAADPLLPVGFPYATFFPAVVAAAVLFGLRAGIVAAIVGGALAWYYFIPPYHSFAINTVAIAAMALYTFVVVTQIALVELMMAANRRLAKERETSALLFRELQHRVSNNIQMVAALLSLQKRGITDPEASNALDEAARRLGVIGRISRQLHDPDGGSLGLRPFLEQLCADIVEANGRDGVSLEIDAPPDLRLEPDAAIPVALIVAEAVANAIEHGFAGRPHGRITVQVVSDTRGIVVSIRDDGHGLPAGFSLDVSTSLGLRIASMLAKQLKGRFELRAQNGTEARLSIPH